MASRSADKARAFASRFDCHAVTGYPALLARDDIDAVYVATPVAHHAEWSIAAASAGKHVLCEKSLAATAGDARRVVAACAERGVALLEGYVYQFHPQHDAVRELIGRGAIGRPLLFQAWFGFPPRDDGDIRYQRELGGGALLDAGGYTVHAARRLFGREPVSAHAALDNGDREVDVHGAVLLDFGHGQTAQLAFGYDNAYQNTYAVWGSRGVVRLTRAFSIPAALPPALILERQGSCERRTLEPANQFAREIEAFCAGIDDPAAQAAWRDDALAQAQAIETIRRSAARA